MYAWRVEPQQWCDRGAAAGHTLSHGGDRLTKKILIVDDDYEIVEFIKAILKTKGYQAVVAYDGEEGLKQLQSVKPDLVILDLRMPKMSGLEFCRAVRRDPELEAVPILVISSLAAEVEKPEEFWRQGLGCDEFLAKPFETLALLGRVEYLLRRGHYVSHQNPDAEPADTGNPPTAAPPAPNGESAGRVERLAEAESDPGEVVRTFVESWNSRAFPNEYDTLGEEMLGGVTRQEYVARRLQLYADEVGDNTRCHVLDMDVDVHGKMATVACLREDVVNGVPRRKDERYTLRDTRNGWKIISVRSRPLTFTIGD